MDMANSARIRLSFLENIKGILSEFESGHTDQAKDLYEKLALEVRQKNVLSDKELETIFYETEFLIFRHGTTTLLEVQKLLHNAMEVPAE